MLSGTVTFLFTDIEGSTRLLREVGADAYAELLAKHHRIVSDAVDGAGGTIVDTQGDAVFAVFPRAQAAVQAATAAQLALAQTGLRVRMGIHTGEPRVEDGNYVGLDVHRAHRVSSVAHGGQVLLSQAARSVLPDELDVKDLGVYRLKDFDRPGRLYQLKVDGLPSRFRPPRTRARRRRTVGVTAAVALAAGAAVAAVILRDSSGPSRPVVVRHNSIAVLDPATDRVVGDVRVGALPSGVAVGAGGVWVANRGDATVTRIDQSTLSPTKTYGVGGSANDIAIDGHVVWIVTGADDSLVRIDARSGSMQTFPLPNGTGAEAVDVGHGAVWVSEKTVLKLDLTTGTVLQKPSSDAIIPNDVLVTPHAVWTNGEYAAAFQLSVRTLRILTKIPMGLLEFHGAYGYGAVWVSGSATGDGSAHPRSAVFKLDPRTAEVEAKTPVGAFADAIAAGAGYIWVANRADGTVSKLDPGSGRVVDTIHVGGEPLSVAVGAGRVWIAVA